MVFSTLSYTYTEVRFLHRKIKNVTLFSIPMQYRGMDFFLLDTSLLSRACERQPKGRGKNVFMPFLKSSLTRAWRKAATRSDVPTQHLLFRLSTISSPASAILMDPVNKGANPFSPESQSSCLVCGRKEVEVTATSRKESGGRSLPSHWRGFLTPWDTCHENGHQIQICGCL